MANREIVFHVDIRAGADLDMRLKALEADLGQLQRRYAELLTMVNEMSVTLREVAELAVAIEQVRASGDPGSLC